MDTSGPRLPRSSYAFFFPQSFFPKWDGIRNSNIAFWFPGGWLIGGGLFINLLAAHSLRFKVQATGTRLWLGLGTIAVGVLTTWLVIASGSNKDGIQEAIWAQNWSTLWTLMKAGLAALWLGTASALLKVESSRKTERWLLIAVIVSLGILLTSLFYAGDTFQLDDSGMRILWQLMKALFAALILLGGCLLLFKKRAGVVLLHSGIGLMMFSELLVGLTAVEAQMQIPEGSTVNFVRDTRKIELAVVNKNDPEHSDENVVVVVPGSILLQQNGDEFPVVEHQHLPFDVQIVRFMKNSVLRDAKSDDENPATAGAGQMSVAQEVKAAAGTDTDSAVDIPAAYIKLYEKGGDKELGTYLFSRWLKEQQVTVGDQAFDIRLRAKRAYKSYWVHLEDVSKDDYQGTDTPRNYSSDVRLIDPSRNVDRKKRIWMNNPLRYAGETFYQTSYFMDPSTGIESTTLAIVTNGGWMIPYVSCMIVAVGMLAHFWVVLSRFLNHREEQARRSVTPVDGHSNSTKGRKVHRIPSSSVASSSLLNWLLPLLLVVVSAAFIGSRARSPKTDSETMDLYQFGKIPVVYQGRSKPIDTLARNSLRMISERQTFVDDNGDRQPAIRWLLDLIAKREQAFKHKVFRIPNPDVRATLELKKRKGLCYSIGEIGEKLKELTKQAEQARQLDPGKLEIHQRKILELERKIGVCGPATAVIRPASNTTGSCERRLDAGISAARGIVAAAAATGDSSSSAEQ